MGSFVANAASSSAEPGTTDTGHTHSRPYSHTRDGWMRRLAAQPCLRRTGTYAVSPVLPNCHPWYEQVSVELASRRP